MRSLSNFSLRLCCVVLRYVVLCCVVLCCAALRCVALCCVVLYVVLYVVLCCVVLCCVVVCCGVVWCGVVWVGRITRLFCFEQGHQRNQTEFGKRSNSSRQLLISHQACLRDAFALSWESKFRNHNAENCSINLTLMDLEIWICKNLCRHWCRKTIPRFVVLTVLHSPSWWIIKKEHCLCYEIEPVVDGRGG